jgi:DNA processing protein
MIYWIWLTLISGLGPVKQRTLLKKFDSPGEIYQASEAELIKCKGIGCKLATRITSDKSLTEADNILKKVKRNNIKLLTLADSLYPVGAKKIKKMPILLYYKGKLVPNSMGVAIIGARRCSQ